MRRDYSRSSFSPWANRHLSPSLHCPLAKPLHKAVLKMSGVERRSFSSWANLQLSPLLHEPVEAGHTFEEFFTELSFCQVWFFSEFMGPMSKLTLISFGTSAFLKHRAQTSLVEIKLSLRTRFLSRPRHIAHRKRYIRWHDII